MATWNHEIPYGAAQSITYNQVGVTYNSPMYTYNGKLATIWTHETKSP